MMDDIILEFWRCSLKNDFSEFDFDEAFDEFHPYLHRNCAGHGLCEFDDYRDYYDDICGLDILAQKMPQELLIDNCWWTFDEYDAVEAIIKALYERAKATFSGGIHGDNLKLLRRIEDRRGLTTPELVQLFDECIHAEHANGFILEDVDIDDLRSEAEEEYEDSKKFPTRIREFL